MDNLTHTLAGLFAADGLLWLGSFSKRHGLRRFSPPSPELRELSLVTTALASNGPDIDFVYVGLTGGKLGYLLHHRGHTHTLLGVLPLALLCAGLAVGIERMRGRRTSGRDFMTLLGFGLFGGLLHLLMDFGNNYGVHPFWPFDNRWYYGDAVFIVDPWLIVALAGAALGALESRVFRILLSLAALGIVVVAWITPFMGAGLAGALSLFAVAWLAWLRRAAVTQRLAAGAAACALVLSLLLVTRHVARRAVADVVASDPALALADLVSTPAPGNPLCWWVAATLRSEGHYVIRQALASGVPALLDVSRCSWPNGDTTAPLREVEPPPPNDKRALRWGPEFRAPLAELKDTLQENCQARAFARFARVPFWLRRAGVTRLIGDFRFDRSSAVDFAELPLEAGAPCPRFEPPWTPPFDPSG